MKRSTFTELAPYSLRQPEQWLTVRGNGAYIILSSRFLYSKHLPFPVTVLIQDAGEDSHSIDLLFGSLRWIMQLLREYSRHSWLQVLSQVYEHIDIRYAARCKNA